MSCPGNPPPPDGYRVWIGNVPPVLAQWANHVLYGGPSKGQAMGAVWTMDYGGEIVLLRLEYHGWTHRNGQLVYGCFKGVTLYRPSRANEPPPAQNPNPDQVAQFDYDEGIDWGMVAISAGAGAAVVGLFWLALHHAGNAQHPRRLPR